MTCRHEITRPIPGSDGWDRCALCCRRIRTRAQTPAEHRAETRKRERLPDGRYKELRT